MSPRPGDPGEPGGRSGARRTNIERKFRCADLASAEARARALGAQDPDGAAVLEQKDTFFEAARSRLKLRVLGDGRAELISYRRDDVTGARPSEYLICEVAAPEHLAAVLDHALGAVGFVAKRRRVLVHRRTRIHLDDVVGLGPFVELETVVTDQTEAEARAELEELVAALELSARDEVPVPYAVLLGREAGERGRS